MTNSELIQPNLDEFKNFKNCLDGVYNHEFFTGKQAETRKAVFVAMIAYALEQGMEELIDNFNPIKLVQTIAQKTGLKIPESLPQKNEADKWDDGWNKELVDFDLAVQRKLGEVYNRVVSFYRFNFNSNLT